MTDINNIIADDLVYYESRVKHLANTGSDELISNGLDEHARILITNIILHSKENVRVFSSSLKSIIYDEENVLNALSVFLDKPHSRIEVILQEKDNVNFNGSKFLSVCNEYNIRNDDDKAKIYEAVEEKDKKRSEHFMTGDYNKYRFCGDKDKTSAVASFNRVKTTSNLNRQFISLVSRAAPIDLSMLSPASV